MAQNNDLEQELIIDTCSSPEPLQLLESVDTPTGSYSGVVLATLDGPVMDYVNPTRNIRLYEEDLCDQIHDSEYVKELEDTKNFLGEPDHPMRYQNRLDIHYPEVSHAIRNFRKVPEKGCYYATFDILDTPNGRILKTLIDYGVKLGVSSRGSGRTVTRNGRIVVDKNTYRFITFDIVCMPGNKIARLPVANESIDSSKTLTEQVMSLLESHDLEQLKSIKPVLNFLSENAEVGSLLDRVNEALEADDGNTIAESATNDLLEAYSTIRDLEDQLKAKDSIINSLSTENANLNESIQALQNTNSEMTKELDRSKDLAVAQLKKEQDARRLLESTQLELEEAQASNQSLQEKLSQSTRHGSMNESVVTQLRKTIEDESEQHATQIGRLQESLDQANADLDYMTDQLKYKEGCYNGLLSKYFSIRCNQLGLNESLVRESLTESQLSSLSADDIDAKLRKMVASKQPKGPAPLTESMSRKIKVEGTSVQSIPKRNLLNESMGTTDTGIVDAVRAVRMQG